MTQVDQQQNKLLDLLIREGAITAEQASAAIEHQQLQGGTLRESILKLGYAESGEIAAQEAAAHGIEAVDLEHTTLNTAATNMISGEVAHRYHVLPLDLQGGTLTVGMHDPFNQDSIEALRGLTGRRIALKYIRELELVEAIERVYGSNVARMIADLKGGNDDGDIGDAGAASVVELQELAREPSVVNLVNLVILEAIEARASDIHVEPFEKELKLKYRVDGALREMSPPPRHLYAAIVSRIKIMGAMNIAERFIPQDGHIAFASARGKVDIRVSTVPTVFGESVVMRILDRSVGLIELARLGLDGQKLSVFERIIEKPHGILLVTGPTGSGKTTTLYAALNKLYRPEKKIITIEDPVEYQLNGINQIPVNKKRGVDFATGLRSILRQDPDVIMVGEIRDSETADIAIRSALTGHLVFSTLHTNDAAGAVTRLMDMHVEPYLLASSLEGVLAQRLVRRVCEKCKEIYQPDDELFERLGKGDNGYHHDNTFYHGAGCRHCRDTGYTGRAGIYELLRVNEGVKKAIMHEASASEIAKVSPEDHLPMRVDGLKKAAMGITTLEEVLRVTEDSGL
ncbi:GspE/PulE family protein [Poriferisphaera sp. WC338]|uniref:GspE/PulE family protein n=1 Tax=Poriferisphaera sp. WC338 TaxID=3425129 RepID=UPI003D816632